MSFKIPSPLQKLNWAVAERARVEIWVKRDDLIHPIISGNKWRKLNYNVKEVQEKKHDGVVTFGGAFSNHIAATAHAGLVFNVPTVGFIRGEEANFYNPTLQKAVKDGMDLIPLTREDYRNKTSPEFLEKVKNEYPNYLIVPEGGSNLNGVLGCMQILPEINECFDYVASPIGSATTFTGLIATAKNQGKVLGFSALKGGSYLQADVENFLHRLQAETPPELSFNPTQNWEIIDEYHFGGFAKINEPLVRFMNDFWRETQLALDPIYTAKMMWGLREMITENKIEAGSKLLVLHTGGLQGIAGMNKRLKNKNYKIEYENNI